MVHTSRHFGLKTILLICSIGVMACGGEPGEQSQEVLEDDPAEAEDIVLVTPGIVEDMTPDLEVMMEADACGAIVHTYGMHGLDIGCATTIKTCPGLFRDSFGVPCMQYEARSIDTCLSNITAATSCEEIRATECEVLPLWGTEPLGCDQPQ